MRGEHAKRASKRDLVLGRGEKQGLRGSAHEAHATNTGRSAAADRPPRSKARAKG